MRAIAISINACLCLLLLHGCKNSHVFYLNFPATHPDTLRAMKVETTPYEKQFGNDYPAVYMVWEQDQELSHAHTYSMQTTNRQRYLVLDPSKEWLSQFRPTLEKRERLDSAVITIRYPDGTLKQFDQNDMRREYGSERTSYKLAYPHITKGTVIEEWYRTVQWHPLGYIPDNYEKLLQFSIPADTVIYRFAAWETADIHVRKPGPDKTTPHTIHMDDTTWMNILTYRKTGVAAVHDEPFSPYNDEYIDYLDFRMSSLSAFSDKAVKSWEHFADRYEPVLESGFSNRYKQILLADSLTAHCSTDMEKMKAVVAYVQQEYQNDNEAPYGTIHTQNLGNSVELICLTRALLYRLDIESDLVFIQPEQEGYYDSTFYSGYQFYRPALYAEIDGQPYFALPYWKYAPIGLLPSYMQNRPAVRIGDSGFNGLMQTPQGSDADNTTDKRFTLTIGRDGKVLVEEEHMLRGFDAVDLRNKLWDMEPEECDRELREMATYIDGNTNFLSHDILHIDEVDSTLTVKLRYEVDNLVALTNNAAILQTAGLLAPRSLALAPARTARHNPVKVRVPWTKNTDITIRYPEQWNISSIPTGKNVSNIFGSVSSSFQSKPGVLTARLRQEVRKTTGMPEQYRDLLDIISDQADPAVPPLVFSVQGS